MIKIGEAAKYLRTSIGVSQRHAGEWLGISYVHINKIENGKASPTAEMIERYFTAWGIDLYMLAVVLFADDARIPQSVRMSAEELRAGWQEEIEKQIDLLKENHTKCEGCKN